MKHWHKVAAFLAAIGSLVGIVAFSSGTDIYSFSVSGNNLIGSLRSGNHYVVPVEKIPWQDCGFISTDYSANGSMTWTGTDNEYVCRYRLDGYQMEMALQIQNTTIAGTASTNLIIPIPGNYQVATPLDNMRAIGFLFGRQGGTNAFAAQFIARPSGGTILLETTPAAANWTLNTNQTNIYGRLSFGVQP